MNELSISALARLLSDTFESNFWKLHKSESQKSVIAGREQHRGLIFMRLGRSGMELLAWKLPPMMQCCSRHAHNTVIYVL